MTKLQPRRFACRVVRVLLLCAAGEDLIGSGPRGKERKWRQSIDEHLELRRLRWDEYALFNWLCTKADPRTGTLRTSWPVLAEQTTLRGNYVGKLCASLKRKGYIAYPTHRGRRRSLVELAIGKFPLPDGTYTALATRPGRTPSEVPAEVLAEVPAELEAQKPGMTGTSPGGRIRKRKRTTSLRVRFADPPQPERLLSRTEALAQAPPAMAAGVTKNNPLDSSLNAA